jgi:hypothetical protein
MFPPSAWPNSARPPGADGVHDRANVVHPLLERGQTVGRDGVGEPGPPLVEQDEPGERPEPLEEPGEPRLLPHEFDVGDEPGDVDEVEGSIADDLVRDAHFTATQCGITFSPGPGSGSTT